MHTGVTGVVYKSYGDSKARYWHFIVTNSILDCKNSYNIIVILHSFALFFYHQFRIPEMELSFSFMVLLHSKLIIKHIEWNMLTRLNVKYFFGCICWNLKIMIHLNCCGNKTLTGLPTVACNNQRHQLKQVNCMNLKSSSVGTHNMADYTVARC